MKAAKAPIDALSAELQQMADAYARKADALADNPHYREAVMKVAVSQFVRSLYHAFDGDCRATLGYQLSTQASVVQRALREGGRL